MAWFRVGAMFILVIIIPFFVAKVIQFQSYNPFSNETWTAPRHYANPFSIGNPLLPVHFVSFVIMAQGAGITLMSFVGGIGQLLFGVLIILGGVAILAGVRLAMRWCEDKMEKANT